MALNDFNAALKFENSFAVQLDGLYAFATGDSAIQPKLVKINHSLAKTLGLDSQTLSAEPETAQQLAAMLSGGTSPNGATPLSQAYAGHQFGHLNHQLGDGRALLLGEVIDTEGRRKDIHLKGSGPTIFSRNGDGKATLGPVLREYLIAEAMHRLQVPTTRALAVVCTGEKVMRSQLLTGAVLTRVASSHIRVGTFQYAASRNQTETIQRLADYCIARHYPQVKPKVKPEVKPQVKQPENCYLDFFRAVADKQALLIAKWMNIGFVHGVMNTDNTLICGETIDYGPCAFIDQYDPQAVFSSIDTQRRYAYQNQASIALWNLARLAETLLPLIAADEEQAITLINPILQDFTETYQQYWLAGMRLKLGIDNAEEDDLALANDLLQMMAKQQVDFTQLFRALAFAIQGETSLVRALFKDPQPFYIWQVSWSQRLARNTAPAFDAIAKMNAINPLYIPRNHKVEEALIAAEAGDFSLFEKLLLVVTDPYQPRDGFEEYEGPAPAKAARYVTYCGT